MPVLSAITTLNGLTDVAANSPADGDILQYVAATSKWTKVSSRSKSFFVPVTNADYTNVEVIQNWQFNTQVGLTIPNDYNSRFFGNFVVPADYKSDLQIKANCIVNGSGDIYIESIAYYRSDGEDADQHNDSYGPTAVTLNEASHLKQIAAITLTTPVAGDIVTIEFYRHGNNAADTFEDTLYMLGFSITYTAEY